MEKEEYEKRVGYIKDLFEYYATIYIRCLEIKDKGAAKEAMKRCGCISSAGEQFNFPVKQRNFCVKQLNFRV